MPNVKLEVALGVVEKVCKVITTIEFKVFKFSEITVRIVIFIG